MLGIIQTDIVNKTKYGIFTPQSLMLYTETNKDNPANLLKRNVILFENLVIVPSGIGPLDGSGLFTKSQYLNSYSKEKIKHKKEFEKLILTIQEFTSDEDELREFYRPSNDETSMWFGENSASYIDFVMKYVQNKWGLDTPDIQSREHKEELEYYISSISGDFQVLIEASTKFEHFSGLFSEIHETAFRNTYGDKDAKFNHTNIINEIEQINHFDFGTLTWDEIIELRKSGFVKDFRENLFSWINDYNSTNDVYQFQKKLNQYIDDAKFDFIENKKPNVIKTSLLGFIGNLPTGIPVNPVGVINSINDVRKDVKTNKEFGWLFFIQKAYKMARAKSTMPNSA